MSRTWWTWQTALLDPCPGIASLLWVLYQPSLSSRISGAWWHPKPFSHHISMSASPHVKVLASTNMSKCLPLLICHHNSRWLPHGLPSLGLALDLLGPPCHFWFELWVCFGLSPPLIKALLKKKTDFLFYFYYFYYFNLFLLFLLFYYFYYFYLFLIFYYFYLFFIFYLFLLFLLF